MKAFSKWMQKVASCISLIRDWDFRRLSVQQMIRFRTIWKCRQDICVCKSNKKHISIQEFERMEFEQLQGEE